jgi:metal-dependent amidase/aminoacylase/carboxypeptidase family protein
LQLTSHLACDEATARLAGTLGFASDTDDGIDALVAAEAARIDIPTVVLTSDPGDLERLVTGSPHVSVRRV